MAESFKLFLHHSSYSRLRQRRMVLRTAALYLGLLVAVSSVDVPSPVDTDIVETPVADSVVAPTGGPNCVPGCYNTTCCFRGNPEDDCGACGPEAICRPGAVCYQKNDAQRLAIEKEYSSFKAKAADDSKALPCYSWCKSGVEEGCCSFSEPARECAGCSPDVVDEDGKKYGCHPQAKCYYGKKAEL